MSADHSVTRDHGATRGRFVIRQGGKAAEPTHSVTTPTLVIADHTGVPDSLRGTGAGLALVAAARKDGFRVGPRGAFGNATRKKHSARADVFV
ncbi:N-acetyltransferase [Rhodobacter calidifons]|uniref:N-acetyltransferase n=1 Tax=Rhodobacter calidifons TaxID=2715277 RepID=A0ABX0GBR0_9RHOB|nr:N-acetyltransferase [Rhodobacter calidifons]NHB78300.1 N-acetyltransferase [Rhodobacter calidifons]